MKNFHIEYPDEGLREALIDKINNLTKPKGSLGVLEDLALQIGLIQQTLSPTLSHPHNVLFAADHGIVEEGVSKSPKEITWQQLSNFLHGGAGVNFLCRQHGFKLVLVDSGVDYDIHDRVNYAVTDAKLKIAEDKSVIALNLQIDEKICSMYDYFEIFLERMMLCRKAAEILGTTFKLTVNGRKVL